MIRLKRVRVKRGRGGGTSRLVAEVDPVAEALIRDEMKLRRNQRMLGRSDSDQKQLEAKASDDVNRILRESAAILRSMPDPQTPSPSSGVNYSFNTQNTSRIFQDSKTKSGNKSINNTKTKSKSKSKTKSKESQTKAIKDRSRTGLGRKKRAAKRK